MRLEHSYVVLGPPSHEYRQMANYNPCGWSHKHLLPKVIGVEHLRFKEVGGKSWFLLEVPFLDI